MSGVTATGFDIRTLEEILAEIEADQRANISANLNQSSASALGQLNGIVTNQLVKVWEALAACYSAFDPDSAGGAALVNLAALTGTTRLAATAARVGLEVNVDPGTYAAGSLVINPTGDPNTTLTNLEDVVNGTGGADDVAGVWEAAAVGVTAFTLSSVFDITSPVTGWNSIGTISVVTNGTDIETDEALRARREAEVQAQGSTTVDAIRADILQNVAGVISCSVVENDTDATVDGIPPHAIEAIVYGPDPAVAADDQAVADQVFLSKAGGIRAYGTTTKTVTDSQGADHTIGLTRPADVDIYFEISFLITDSDYAGDANLISEVVDAAAAYYGPGGTVYAADLLCFAKEVPGVLSLAVRIGLTASPSDFDVAISSREVSRWDTARGSVV